MVKLTCLSRPSMTKAKVKPYRETTTITVITKVGQKQKREDKSNPIKAPTSPLGAWLCSELTIWGRMRSCSAGSVTRLQGADRSRANCCSSGSTL
ncbi:hypothetical protein J6590_018077 [Homalodisca vitripennis]|nr:hypothetical protein J6590_018077 [Homalodisca vitripennis]